MDTVHLRNPGDRVKDTAQNRATFRVDMAPEVSILYIYVVRLVPLHFHLQAQMVVVVEQSKIWDNAPDMVLRQVGMALARVVVVS